MAIEWHQVEDFFASQEGHWLRVQPITMGPGYTATMQHLNELGLMETVMIPARNEMGEWTTGTAFPSIDDAKAEAERFLADHLTTPVAQRGERLAKIQSGEMKHG